MTKRARTTRQSAALAFGTMAYRNRGMPNLGFDVESLKRRNAREKELKAQGLQMCWFCEKGFDPQLSICPHCQTDVVPF